MRISSASDRRNPDAWDFERWERDWALKRLIQVIAFDDADALRRLREKFKMLEDKRPRCPECHRRGCEPWNHDERNSDAVCRICYEKDCTAKEHA